MKEQIYDYVNKTEKNLNAKCRPALCLKPYRQNTEENHISLRNVLRFIKFYFMPF